MENPVTDPTNVGFFSAFIIKFKVYIVAGIMALLSSAYKYRKDRKEGNKTKAKDLLSYLFVTTIVVFTTLGGMIKLGFEIDLLGYMIMFLCGQSSEYIMMAFDRLIKAFAESEIKKIEDED